MQPPCMTTSSKRELLIGKEVDKITTGFPLVNLTEATAEIKASQPKNMALQNLTVPKSVGGEVHNLLGMQYVAHFPKHVHSLESWPHQPEGFPLSFVPAY